MDRGAWWPTVQMVAIVRYSLAAKPPPLQNILCYLNPDPSNY